ncbi:MAG: DegT/DnrJ/EryC1/StrS family aminotransferase [Bacteroidota bacterium]
MILHNKPTIGIEEIEASSQVLSSGWLAQGEQVLSFENEFCDFLGIPKGCAVAVSSGTSALYLSLWGLKAKKKSVAFPSYVCAALRNAVGMINGKEILVDNAPESPNIDIQSLNSHSPDIAIIPHMYGLPVDITKIKAEFIIEDCCQSLGAKVKNNYVGLAGKIGIYSFYATKLITSGGQGGMIVCEDLEILNNIRNYREFDQRKDRELRFNFQITDLQAAIGRTQLRKLPAFLKRRSEIYAQYRNAGLDLLDSDLPTASPIRYRSILKTSKPNQLKEKLNEQGINTIVPIEDWELLGSPSLFPIAYKMTQNTLSLPTYPSLSDQDLNLIIKSILRIYDSYRSSTRLPPLVGIIP